MRTRDPKRHLGWLPLVAVLAIIAPGCGEGGNPGIIPEPKSPGATRAGIEDPAGVDAKKKMSPRAKAAAEKAKALDPRLGN